MRTFRVLLATVLAAGWCASTVLADGMIVPVRPDIRVRGHWAVNYHHVRMTVRDQVASVTIDQEFVNTGRGMIEVEYFFPVPPDTAIDAMTLIVDGKEYAAKLLEADEARKIYEDIVRRKKDPALLEYAGFGLYRTRAFPLQPNKPVKVVVHYETLCRKDRDMVEVWYPLNTEKFSARAIKDVKVTVDIKSRSDITAVYSPSHDLSVDRKDAKHVIATYHEKKVLPATDFQMFYKAADEAVGAMLLTYRPNMEKDGYFLMLVSPNPRITKQKIVPKDVIIVLDHSGSMSSGGKITQAKGAARFILKNLGPEDRFGLILYSDTVDAAFEELAPANREKIAEAEDYLDRVDARGGTNIHDALQLAMSQWPVAGVSDSRPKYVVFLTDGLPTVGKTGEKDILDATKAANKAGARLFAFGVGYDVNVRLLDKLVGENGGRSDYVKPAENIEAKISSLYAKIKNPVMTGLKVKIKGIELRDTYPRELGDLFEGGQIVAAGRYRSGFVVGKRVQLLQSYETTLIISGIYEGEQRAFEYPVTIRKPGANSRFAFVERLWAIRRVGWLMDQIQLHGKNKEIVDELVELSKQYGIITPYTSFLADERTVLSDRSELRSRMVSSAGRLKKDISGSRGQQAAKTRQALNEATIAVPAQSPTSSGTVMFGNADKFAYEAGDVEVVETVRNVGDQAIYRRGQVWVASNASDVDLKRDRAKIKEISRFSDEYFSLVRANSIGENQIFAQQQPDEQLLIRLRGQAYLIR